MVTRTLDYVPRLDERNRAHRVTAAPDLTGVSRYWTPGVVLDQGQEGSCVGHGVVGEYLASPVRGTPWKYHNSASSPAEAAHLRAVEVYEQAKTVDEWEGVDYDGTSVRAGMLVGRERGWYDGFKWAFNLAELRTALEDGPVVIGVEWRSGMYDTDPGGFVRVGGNPVGGHCLVVTGYSPNYRGYGRYYRWRNSWGAEYGKSGTGYIHADDLSEILFKTGGEAAVPTGRHL